MPTRSEQRRINVQQGKPVNEGLEDCKTCKDCIHYDVCAKYNKVYERELSHRYCTECKDFKDKSRYIELPCVDGDILNFEGVDYKLDHWNVLATAFSTTEEKRIHLFSVDSAEKALKGGEG